MSVYSKPKIKCSITKIWTCSSLFNFRKMMVEFVFIMFDEIEFYPLLLCWHFFRSCARTLPAFNRNFVSYCLNVSFEGRRRKVARVHLTLFHFMDTKYKDLNIEIIARKIFQIYSLFFKIIYCLSSENFFKIVFGFCRLDFAFWKKVKRSRKYFMKIYLFSTYFWVLIAWLVTD